MRFCCLQITFANSLDPDQDQQNVSPDLDPKFNTLVVFLKRFLENIYFGKSANDNKSMKNYQASREIKNSEYAQEIPQSQTAD